MKNNILVVRLGAIGDMLGITSLLAQLKQNENNVFVLTKDTGKDILANNPNVDKIILYSDELKKAYPDKENIEGWDIHEGLKEFFDKIAKENECSTIIDLCESWEVKIARHPAEPNYKLPKNVAKQFCDINYYDQIHVLANQPIPDRPLPEMYFTDDEHTNIKNQFIDFRKIGKKVIVWGLSGSAANKTYPYVPEVVNEILEKHKDVCFVTVGDNVCQILEVELKHDRIINKSGLLKFRESALACKYADLVIAPDTGLLHAAGCFDTPKIGLLNHTSRNNITKHFLNDYSLHAEDGKHPVFGDISCAPCYQIHYAKKVTCNMAECKHTEAPVCMVYGIPPQQVIKTIEKVLW